MDDRYHNDADDDQKNNARKKRVKRGEDFSRGRLKSIDGSHPAENHSRVEERVEPAQMLEKMIARYTQAERGKNNNQSGKDMPEEPANEPPIRQ